MFTNLISLNNLDLLIVGAVVAATCVLGFLVYFNNKNSITNRSFLFFSVITALWGVVTYFSYKFTDPITLLWLFRLTLFFAVFQAFFLYRLLLVFPVETYVFSGRHKYFLIPAVVLVSLLTLTPFVFSGIVGQAIVGQVALVKKGFGLVIFALLAVGLVVKALYVLVVKIKHSKNLAEKKTFVIILTGLVIMFLLIIFFNLILSTAFSNPRFIPLGALFTFPFIILTYYAILKRKLFNIKVAATSTMVLLLSIALFLEIIFTDTLTLIVFRSCVFLLVLVFGINLIRSVLIEVRQREHLQILTLKLEDSNKSLANLLKQRESLMHLITHKVKGSFTRTKVLFASMLDGTFGEISPEIKRRAEQGLEFDNGGLETVDLILNVANMQNGIIKYELKPLDLKAMVEKVISEKRIPAEAKKLKLEEKIEGDNFNVLGDSIWLKEAINNLVENSIRYTREGSVTIGLEKNNGKILFSVKDTGVGISEEDKKNLFTEGGRGKESVKVNVDSTGYGLYTVKLVVDGHSGHVWAESEGEGKGSQFYIELPDLNKV